MEIGTNNKITTKTNWMDSELSSFLEFVPPLKQKLYSKVAEKIVENGCKKILDYGCGEGNQVAFLDKKLNIDLYDINKTFSLSAYDKYKDYYELLSHIDDSDSFERSSYDAVIVNMVWMCLKDKSEIDLLLDNVLKTKKENGILLLSITNPYSRDLEFSYYETEYSKGKKEFNYFNNGEAFDVFIKNEPHTIFTDYHWTLEYTLKSLRERNLVLKEYIELKDENFNSFSNAKISPYILLILK